MRNSIPILATLLIVLPLAFAACHLNSGKPEERVEDGTKAIALDSASMVRRGEYLVNSIGCADCHSPKQMGDHGPEIIPELHLSGFSKDMAMPLLDASPVKNGWVLFSPDLTTAVGPWGQSFAANITSDPSGIGNWTEENFMRAIRDGKFKGLAGSRELLPPMPWHVYRNMTDEDLRSIFYYLKSTNPVENFVPAPKNLSDLY